ncbi:MAG: FAD-dependent oxidoreductase [Rhodothermales bacterium]
MTEHLIVGGGLAGACAALWLSEHGSVTVLEAERPAAGASGAAAGLVNPFMAHRANPAWRFEDALAALHATLDRAGAADLFRATGLLRPARDAKQARTFRDRADALPDYAAWQSADALAAQYPDVAAQHGGLWIPAGGAVDLGALVETLLHAATARGATVRSGVRVVAWGEEETQAWVETAEGERITARHVVLALGDGFRHVPELAALPLHRIKGQTIRIARPDGLGPLPSLSGFGYVAPDGDTLVVGSSYEHDFDDLEPSAAESERLVAQSARMVPALAGARVLEARAGVRVTVPRTHSPQRLPLLGPLPGRRRVWVFTGLGSKGLLTAPLLARDLPAWLDAPAQIPAEVRAPR